MDPGFHVGSHLACMALDEDSLVAWDVAYVEELDDVASSSAQEQTPSPPAIHSDFENGGHAPVELPGQPLHTKVSLVSNTGNILKSLTIFWRNMPERPHSTIYVSSSR